MVAAMAGTPVSHSGQWGGAAAVRDAELSSPTTGGGDVPREAGRGGKRGCRQGGGGGEGARAIPAQV